MEFFLLFFTGNLMAMLWATTYGAFLLLAALLGIGTALVYLPS